MYLESIIQSEGSQKEKDRFYTNIYMESRKMIVMNLFAGQQWRNRHRDRLMDTGGGEERVRCMDRVTWKLTLPYVK